MIGEYCIVFKLNLGDEHVPSAPCNLSVVTRLRRPRSNLLRLTAPTWWIALGAVGTVVVLALVLLTPALWVINRGPNLSQNNQLQAEAAVRTSLMQLLGGGLVLAGLVYTARTLKLTREGHITSRYSSAIEQLGHGAIDVRLGGIFALERIARDSEADRSTVIEVLTAFIRNHTRLGPNQPSPERIDAAVQAAITVLGRRPGTTAETQRLDLSHCGLTGADLRGNFDRANLTYCRLDHALFTGGSYVDASLSFATGKTVGFNRADAHGAHFVHASFKSSWFIDSDLSDTDFYGCDLTGTDMGRRYDDSGAPAAASRLRGARLATAVLEGTNLGGNDLSEVSGLIAEQLAVALIDENTLMPIAIANDTSETDA